LYFYLASTILSAAAVIGFLFGTAGGLAAELYVCALLGAWRWLLN